MKNKDNSDLAIASLNNIENIIDSNKVFILNNALMSKNNFPIEVKNAIDNFERKFILNLKPHYLKYDTLYEILTENRNK